MVWRNIYQLIFCAWILTGSIFWQDALASSVPNDNSSTQRTNDIVASGTMCNGITCPTGGRCVVNETNQAICVCNESCPSNFDPVCGSDGTTYSTECHLKKEACRTNSTISVEYSGLCMKGTACYGVKCPIGKRCTVDEYNRPLCVCNPFCSKNYKEVCGSDGRTYENECLLQEFACLQNINISVIYNGSCGSACGNVDCPYWHRCIVLGDKSFACVCPENCSNSYDPVCGSDSKTYYNDCFLEEKACKTNASITVAYLGECRKGSGCESVECDDYKHCEVNDDGNRTSCVCNTCPPIHEPICGTDKKTYENECEAYRAGCLANTYLFIDHFGRCEDSRGCYDYYCPNNRVCVADENNNPRCVCGSLCYANYDPVCGTNNKSYINECFMHLDACMINKSISMVQKGVCGEESPCDGFTCEFPRYCASDEKRIPSCICPKVCSSHYDQVCGSDGITYRNLCRLQSIVCLTNRSLTVAYHGNCGRPTNRVTYLPEESFTIRTSIPTPGLRSGSEPSASGYKLIYLALFLIASISFEKRLHW